MHRPTAADNTVIPMFANIVYQGSTSQSNQAHINASDIPIYDDEILENQYEELSVLKKSNLDSNDDANQDNESYVSQVNQQDQELNVGHADK